MRTQYPGDITIESGPLESTGGKVWDASLNFFRFLSDCDELKNPERMKILELGSGCGWLGMRLSKQFVSASILMSEQSQFGALDWLNHNISLNPGLNLEAVELDWAHLPENVASSRWDFVIGCELVYSYGGACLLASVLGSLLGHRGSVCFYAHSLNRFESVDERMFAEFERNNLCVEVVYGNRDSIANIGSFGELFREIELVIFRITKRI